MYCYRCFSNQLAKLSGNQTDNHYKWAWCELRQLKTSCELFEGLITKQLPGKNFKQGRKTGNPRSRHGCFHIEWVSLYHLVPYKWDSELHVVGEWFGIYIHVPIGNSFYHSDRHQNWKTHKQKGVIYPRNAQETSSWWNYVVNYPTNYATLKGWYQFGLNIFNNPNVHANRCLKKNNRCWFWIHGISWDSLRGARYGFGTLFPKKNFRQTSQSQMPSESAPKVCHDPMSCQRHDCQKVRVLVGGLVCFMEDFVARKQVSQWKSNHWMKMYPSSHVNGKQGTPEDELSLGNGHFPLPSPIKDGDFPALLWLVCKKNAVPKTTAPLDLP